MDEALRAPRINDYLFKNGDVIRDGETVDGAQPGERWPCSHEVALIAPERAVLKDRPGPQ